MIDMTNWTFNIGFGPSALVAARLIEPPTPLSFQTVVDLLKHLAADDELPAAQIEGRLRAGSQAMGWHKCYTRLKAAPHFRAYRGKKYNAYKAAALARAAGTTDAKQLALANGLSDEVGASQVVVPRGQIVLHGRMDRGLSAKPVYDAFLSTTLSPFVAHLSAIRRKRELGGRETIYVLTLARDLRAMWGHVGFSPEWELLFDAGLPVLATESHPGGRFDIVEAELG